MAEFPSGPGSICARSVWSTCDIPRPVMPTYTNRIPRGPSFIIEPSVGSFGDSYDNALAETINGLYKADVNQL